MKKLFLPILFIAFFASCDKDKSDNTPSNSLTNYVTYNGNHYDMGGACLIENYGAWGEAGMNNFDIQLTSPEIYYDSENMEFAFSDTTSIGSMLYLEMFTSDTMLSDGVYNFSLDESDMSFDIGEFYRYNYTEETYPLEVYFTSGSVTIQIDTNESAITIDIDGVTMEDEEITAHYEGGYNYADYTKKGATNKKKSRLNKH